MATVQPIRDKQKIKMMKLYLKDRNEKYYILFLLGINSGLRVSDLLELKVNDIQCLLDTDKVCVSEQKTGKKRKLMIYGKNVRKDLKAYISNNQLAPDDYLIPSRKGENKPISRIQAYRILNDAARAVGLDEIGTHTLRKTFGYHYYKKTHDLPTLMKIFNHSSQGITLRYIGITEDTISDSLKDFEL